MPSRSTRSISSRAVRGFSTCREQIAICLEHGRCWHVALQMQRLSKKWQSKTAANQFVLQPNSCRNSRCCQCVCAPIWSVHLGGTGLFPWQCPTDLRRLPMALDASIHMQAWAKRTCCSSAWSGMTSAAKSPAVRATASRSMRTSKPDSRGTSDPYTCRGRS